MSTPEQPEQPKNTNVLSEYAKKWLEKLPPEAQPKETVEQYPRLVNRIATAWKHPEELMEYIDELLVNTRGDRAGFPMKIALELATLKDYYEMNVHPDSKAYLWDPRNMSDKKDT